MWNTEYTFYSYYLYKLTLQPYTFVSFISYTLRIKLSQLCLKFLHSERAQNVACMFLIEVNIHFLIHL
jgi:hypothetical protein